MKVLLAIGNRLLRAGVEQALEGGPDVEVIASIESAPALLPAVREHRPEIVLLGEGIEGLPLLPTIDRLRAEAADVRIAVLSDDADERQIQAVLGRGANGYILTTIDPRDLPAALRQTLVSTVYHALGLARGERDDPFGLTERERRTLELLVEGLSNQMIARRLSVTEQAVKFHLTHIYRKLGVPNRLMAVRVAYEHGFVQPGRPHERDDETGRA